MLQNLERLKPLALLLLRISLGAILIFYGAPNCSRRRQYIQSFPAFRSSSYFTYIAGWWSCLEAGLLIVGCHAVVGLLTSGTCSLLCGFTEMGNLSAAAEHSRAVTWPLPLLLWSPSVRSHLARPAIFGRKTRQG